MRYFIITDVHGYFDIMKNALDKAGFNPEEDTLISLGDAIDRGPDPMKVISYLMSLPHKVLIRGNHEDLAYELTMQVGDRRRYDGYDVSNGTFDTMRQLAAPVLGCVPSEHYAKVLWDELCSAVRGNTLWLNYLNSTINYFELDKYIFVHGWIPTDRMYIDSYMSLTGKLRTMYKYIYLKNWRNASADDWYNAHWSSGIKATKEQIFEPNKKIVCGHWHCSAWNYAFKGTKDEWSDFNYYEDDNVIAVDACTAYSGKVNVVIISE